MRYRLLLALPLVLLASVALAQEPPPLKPPPAPEAPDDIEALKKRVTEQEELIRQLTKELNEARKTLEEHLKKEKAAQLPTIGDARPGVQLEPPVEGQITKVRPDGKVVLINLGTDHKLAEGDIFEVSRAGKKIGKIVLRVIVLKDMSNAELLESDVDMIPGDKVVRIARAPKQFPPPKEDKAFEKPTYDKPPEEPEVPRSEAQKLSKRINVLEGLFADLAKQVQRLVDRLENNSVAVAEEKVRKSVPAPPEPDRIKRSAELTATILDITKKFVFLAVGTDHGVKEGDVFIIKRGEREVATVKVSKTDTDICRADIVTKKTEIRKVGDVAILQ